MGKSGVIISGLIMMLIGFFSLIYFWAEKTIRWVPILAIIMGILIIIFGAWVMDEEQVGQN